MKSISTVSCERLTNVLVKGLYTRDMDCENGDVRYLEGLDAPVHSLQYIKAIQVLNYNT